MTKSLEDRISVKTPLIFFTLVFLLNLFLFVYVGNYNSRYYEYNRKILNDSHLTDLCLEFQKPWGGFDFYVNVFSVSFILIEVSALLIFAFLFFRLFKGKYIFCNLYQILFALFLIFASWVLLFGAWTGVDVAFYNYIKMYC